MAGQEETPGVVRLRGQLFVTKDGRPFEPKRLMRSGGSVLLVVPYPWVRFFGTLIGEDIWVKWRVELGQIVLSPLDEAETEAVKAHLDSGGKAEPGE